MPWSFACIPRALPAHAVSHPWTTCCRAAGPCSPTKHRGDMSRLIILVLLWCSTAYTQPYDLNIHLKGKGRVAIPLQDIQKLTFAGAVTTVENQKLADVVKTFTILQNYPNPFNPRTTIEYELPAAGTVEIRIFNVNGQLVKSLGADQQPPGLHTAVWDGTNEAGRPVAGGVYFCRLETAAGTRTRAIIVRR